MKTRAETIAELGLPSVESIVDRVEAVLPDAEFYLCDDCGEGTLLTTPFDALVDALQNWWHDAEPSDGPPELTVYEYVSNEIQEKDYAAAAEYAARIVIEDLEENFSCGEGRPEVDRAEQAMAAAFLPIVRQHYPQSLARSCSATGKDCTLTEEEAWSIVLDDASDDDLAEWVEAAKAWLASPLTEAS